MTIFLRILTVAALLNCFASVAAAADSRDLTQDEMLSWGAVGRLSFNGRQETNQFGCSATLIAPDLVLTAAHCLTYAFDGAPSKVRQLVFQAGLHLDHSLASAKAARLVFHPQYQKGGPETFAKRIPFDLALVVLDTPLTEIAPIPLGQKPEALELLDFVVYQGPPSNPPRHASGCSHAPLDERLIQVGCPVIGGNSGGGLLAQNGEERRLVGVIAAASGARALAVIPGDWLRNEIDKHLNSN